MASETYGWRRRLPHLQREGRMYFITWVTVGRRTLSSNGRSVTLETIVEGHLKSYWLYVAVVMPDHVHVILMLYPQSSLPKALKFIKSVSSRRMGGGNVWLDEYFDRIVRHDENLRRLGDYTINNPVRKGLVETIDEYRWIWRVWIDGRQGAGEDTRAPFF
jgi:REP element-mobilizing transposase RayT